jgi:predicted phage tail protein
MQKKIILHGHLADKYPHEIVVEAATVAEAMRALKTIDELTPAEGEPWPVTIKDVNSEIALFSETSMDEIHVYPRVSGGGGKGGAMQILLGIVLIAIAIFVPFVGAAAATMLFQAGAMMILGGILQMLVPTPEGTEESQSSRYLGAAGNTVKIGTRIPIAYGNNKLAGQYLSFDVDAVEWAGDDEAIAGSGAATLVADSVFVEHDKTAIALVPVNPIFSSQTAGVGNIPVAGWSP